MDYTREDRTALHNALLALGVCPFCRRPLTPVYTSWGMDTDGNQSGCVRCDRTYPVPVPEHKGKAG